MLTIALVGYSKNEGMKENTDIMESLNLGVLTIIIIVAAGATVLTSFLGAIGAYFKNMLLLKLVRILQRDITTGSETTTTQTRRNSHVCSYTASLPLCVCFCLS